MLQWNQEREKRVKSVYKAYEKLCHGKDISRDLIQEATKVHADTQLQGQSKKRGKVAVITAMEIASFKRGNAVSFNKILSTLDLPSRKKGIRKRLKNFYGIMVMEEGFLERSISIINTILTHLEIPNDKVVERVVLKTLDFLRDESICIRDSRDSKVVGLTYITLSIMNLGVTKRSFVAACERLGVKRHTVNRVLKNLALYKTTIREFILTFL